MDFTNKVVIVTGGASGIGRGIVECFVQEGARVVIADWNEKEGQEVCKGLTDQGYSCLFLPVNVAVEAEVDRLIEETLLQWGTIDILINNVGTHFYKKLIDVTIEEWDRIMSTDLRGHFLVSKKVLPHMIKQNHGNIVNISSTHAMVSATTFGSYAAAKGGIVSMTRSMAVEYAPYGIRVNVVLPGWTRNRILDEELAHLNNDDKNIRMREMAVNIPLGRIADPTEIGSAVVFLASDKASYITGSCLTIDGGLTSRVII